MGASEGVSLRWPATPLVDEVNVSYSFGTISQAYDVRYFEGLRVHFRAVQRPQTLICVYYTDINKTRSLAAFPVVAAHQQTARLFIPNQGPFVDFQFSNLEFINNPAIRSFTAYNSNFPHYPSPSSDAGAFQDIIRTLTPGEISNLDVPIWFTGPAHLSIETAEQPGVIEVQSLVSFSSTLGNLYDRVAIYDEGKFVKTTHSLYLPPNATRIVFQNTGIATATYRVSLVGDSFYV